LPSVCTASGSGVYESGLPLGSQLNTLNPARIPCRFDPTDRPSLTITVPVPTFLSDSLTPAAVFSSVQILNGTPDLLLVTIICVALLRGPIAGAAAGFWGGILLDTATLGTLGVSSLLLTVAGYWAGRYGETTGRGRRYAAPLAAFAISILAGFGAVALHFLLGEPVAARDALVTAVPSAILAAVLAFGVSRITGEIFEPPRGLERPRQVELV